MTAASPLTYSVEAYNVSHASENKIHDDTVARRLGFTGGLVPGVEVYAYATHPAVARWGRAFLERGRLEARFAKPVYDGRTATVTAAPAGEGLEIRVESDGALCATGTASLAGPALRAPDVSAYQSRTPPPLEARPPADEASLAEGTWLGIAPCVLTSARLAEYLGQIRERHTLYAAEGIAHPGLLLRLANALLRENVQLPPWIHVGSSVQSYAVARVGDELAARGRVARNYERKGHRLVDLDCVLTAGGRVVAHVAHTAIYRLRQLG